MSDPLSRLRAFTIQKKPVILDSKTNHFNFDGVHVKREALTNFISKKGQPYTLDAVWFLLHHFKKEHRQYIVECGKHKFPPVSLPDKKDLVAYLTGEKDTVPQIKEMVPELLIPNSYNNETSLEPPVKRTRLNEEGKVGIIAEEPNITSDDLKTASLGLSEDTPAPSVPPTLSKPVELSQQELKSKESHVKRLEQSKVQQEDSGNAPKQALSQFAAESGLSEEKIEVLKRIRNKRKRGAVGGAEDAIKKNTDSMSFRQKTAAITRDIMSRERSLKTRTSILQSDKKGFNKIIATLKEKEKEETEVQKKKESQKRKRSTKSYDRYEFEEDKVMKEKLKGNDWEEFGIDTRGTFATDTGGLSALTNQTAPLQRANNAKPSSNGPPNQINTPGAAPTQQPPKPSDKATASQPSKTAITAHRSEKDKRKSSHSHRHRRQADGSSQNKQRHAVPIIIIPGALESLINIFNAKEFLEDGLFIPAIEKKKNGAKRETTITITRKKGKDTLVPYKVIDNVARMSKSDWERVVAVFAQGARWQFKGWHWSDPVDLFHNVRGFYIHFNDEDIPETIKSWNVKILTINKHKRHLDKTAALEFWSELDSLIPKTEKWSHLIY